jgi:hypothetical protein
LALDIPNDRGRNANKIRVTATITVYALSQTALRKRGPFGAALNHGNVICTVPPWGDGLSTLYHDLLRGSYDCVDRIVANAYFRMGHDPGGFRLWWRQLTGSEATLTKQGNCFTHASDPAALAKIAETLSEQRTIGRLSQLCDRWIYSACLCLALGAEEQRLSSFRYQYSNYQIEYSHNLVFEVGGHMEQVFQALTACCWI